MDPPVDSGSGLGVQSPDLTARPPDLARKPPDLRVPIDLRRTPRDLTEPPLRDADGVYCGNVACALNEQCCVVVDELQNVTTSCMTSCPDGGITVSCDGPEDCGGNPCCAQFALVNNAPQVDNIEAQVKQAAALQKQIDEMRANR